MGLATHCNTGYNSYKKIFARLFKEMQYFTLQRFDRICRNLAQIFTDTAQGSKLAGTYRDLAQTLTDTGQISNTSKIGSPQGPRKWSPQNSNPRVVRNIAGIGNKEGGEEGALFV
ncbi:hypothetical protein K435DRAFT_809664 [Dendrothele bispora CBS 962.96]|uniref:Uncharacterized protein n=1 Tax=Dendrothele bispora (strain CBS 962.96) TaxID=1314807 RepID=A0A4S8KXI7_DENBC|nr:hypothetical protein K435DRAFT_809664 [Dendrothele bispora CBS 962.96]